MSSLLARRPEAAPYPSLQEIRTERARRDPAEWARQYRRIQDGPFEIIPPLLDLYRDRHPAVVVTKAAQVFVSEYCVNLAFFVADTRQGGRGHTLYIFPAREQLGDFVRARIDSAIEQSPYLRERVRPVRGLAGEYGAGGGKSADNVGLKRIGQSFIYFRGSNAESGLLSVDADLVVYDEVDRLRPGTLDLGAKRLGSSLLGWQRFASTPRYPETGISALWQRSDRRRYHVRCGHCGERQAPAFPDNAREDGEVVCRRCKGSLDRLAAGEWVAEQPGADMHGYHMTKLLSPRADIAALVRLGYQILNRDVTDASAVQEFHNQDLGLPHTPEGGQLSRADLEACIADYSLRDWKPTGCSMGVDVGSKLHVRINAPGPAGKPRAAYIGSVRSFEDLDTLMRGYDVSRCVVDAAPEGHAARQFQARWPGRVWLCHYPNTATWSHQEAAVWNDQERTVNAHRTLTMDATFAQVRERRIEYPREVMAIPEFAEHMMASVRVVERDGRGNLVARYVETGPDHFGHAENYMCIAESRQRLVPFGWMKGGAKQ